MDAVAPAPRLRVLGPLEVRAGDDRVLDLGGFRRTRLLAILAVRAGHAVGYDHLAEAIWDVDAPPTARRQAQNAVSQIRSLLHRAGAGIVIATLPTGYRLDVDPRQVDVWWFRHLVASAERRAAGGDAAGAADDLGRALALWRGPALAGLDSGVLRREAAVLDDARLVAAERWAGLALATGRPDPVVPVLTDLVGQHPLRERVVLHLMTALHRTGRGVAAIDAYRRLTADLDRELGVAPGPELRRLRDTILRAGAGTAEPPPPVAVGPPVPAQLPAPPQIFEGRAADLRRLDAAALREPHRVVIVEGPAGVGKSALAVRWAHDVRTAFPDGQLFIDLRGFSPGPPPSTRAVLAGFVQALGVPPARIPTDLAALQGLYRSLLADRRMLVLLDNAATVERLMPLLPGTSASTVLVTSRRRLPTMAMGLDAHRVDLAPLDRPAAVALLRTLTGATATETAADRPAATETHADTEAMADLCAGLPLALRICAANAVAGHAHGGLDRLRAARLDALALAEPHQVAVRSALRPSYLALPERAARLFRLLGVAPGAHLAPATAAALLGADRAATTTAVAALVDSYLLTRRPDGRLQMHDLVRLYAAERCAEEHSPADTAGAITRLREFYRVTGWTATRTAWPNGQPGPAADAGGLTFAAAADARAWLDRERTTLVATLRHAAADAADHAALAWAVDTAAKLMPYLWAHRHVTDWLDIGEAVAAAAERAGDRLAQARISNFLGVGHWSVNDYGPAIDCINRAFDLNTRLGRTRGAAANISNLAAMYRATGRLDAAVEHGLTAVRLYESVDDVTGRANALLTIAMVHADAGRLTQALTLVRELIVTYRGQNHADGEASALLELHRILTGLGRTAEALAAADAVLHLPSDVLSQINRATAVAARANAARPHTAAQLAELSALLDDLDNNGDGHVGCEVALAAGTVAARLGRHREAIGYFRHAETRAADIGDVLLRVEATRSAAVSGHRLSPHPDHPRRLRAALSLARRNGLRIGEARCQAELAVVLLELGDPTAARAAATAALGIQRRTGLRIEGERRLRRLARAGPSGQLTTHRLSESRG